MDKETASIFEQLHNRIDEALDSKEPASDDVKEVYARFGLAYYQAEVLYRGLCNLYSVSQLPPTGPVTRHRVEEHLHTAFEMTLGQLLPQLQPILPPPVLERLSGGLERRNFIAHHFWYERIHLMATLKGIEVMMAELAKDTEVFQELDREVEKIAEPLHARMGLTPELFVTAFNDIKSGKAGALDPLHPQRMPRRQETVVNVFNVPTSSGHTVLVFQTDDGLLWQLCDAGMGWSPYDQVDPSWPMAQQFVSFLPARINPLGQRHRRHGFLKSRWVPAPLWPFFLANKRVRSFIVCVYRDNQPMMQRHRMPKSEPNKITEVTRRYIIDALLLDREPFYGRLDLVGFLRRIWPLKDMPSTDSRFEDAEGDIWQHMVNNDDETTDYLFYNRLDVLDMPDERFARFLEECVHPLVSTGTERTARLASVFNGYLSQDGFALRPNGQISGHKLYKLVSTTGASALPEAYEVVLSFAGEDREYVDEVAEHLKVNDVSLFYDMYEEATLWGKDLYEHLYKVYSGSARYCVMFISASYAEKIWPTHERRSGFERAIAAKEEYILPARFDDTPLPGLRKTIHYIDLRKKSPEEFATLILKKLGRHVS